MHGLHRLLFVPRLMQNVSTPSQLTVIIIKNRFRGDAQGSGYRDLNVAVVFEGFVCEIQVRTLKSHGGGHNN